MSRINRIKIKPVESGRETIHKNYKQPISNINFKNIYVYKSLDL